MAEINEKNDPNLSAPPKSESIDVKYAEDAEPVGATTSPNVSLGPEDGGRRAYLTLIGTFFAMFATFGQTNSFGTFQLWYQEHQLSSKSPSDISWIGSLQFGVFFFSGCIVGRLFDAYGPTRLLALGTLLSTISLMMTSLCHEYYQFVLAQGLLFGSSIGFIFYPTLAALATHWSKYRATAVGIAVTGSSAGGVAFPIMFGHLFNLVGFPWAVRISGFITLACCGFATLVVTSRFPPYPPGPWLDIESFKDLKYMLLCIGSAVSCLGLTTPTFYIVQYAQDHGISTQLAFNILAIMNAGSAIGRIIPPVLADRIGRYNLYIPCSFMSGVVSLSLWLTAGGSSINIIWYSVLYGVFSGAFIAISSPCIAQVSKIEKIGVRIGMFFAICSVSSLVAGPISGAILSSQHGGYSGLIIWNAVTMMGGAVIVCSVKLMLNPNFFAKV